MSAVPPHASSQPESPPAEAQRRILAWRAALVLGEGAGVGLLAGLLDARLPLASLVGILILHAGLDVVAWARSRAGGLVAGELLLHLAVDAAAIAALVYLTGGYANPFISLLLVPLILASVTLRPIQAWAMAAWVGLLYTLLMRYYVPLELRVSAEAAVDLHLSGMWLNFLLTAALVAAFAGRLATALRRRDAELAAAREQRLRDEHLFSLGLQAASAAHDLATPLASLRISVDDLRRDYAGDEELEHPLALLSGQLGRMEAVLARLADAARSREGGGARRLPPAEWMGQVLEHWGLMWPRVRVLRETAPDMPDMVADAALEATLITLLNNAAQAGVGEVEVSAGIEAGRIVFRVADRGPGLDADGKAAGWGVGLDLARAGLERLGGHLHVAGRPGGGVVARIDLPIPESRP